MRTRALIATAVPVCLALDAGPRPREPEPGLPSARPVRPGGCGHPVHHAPPAPRHHRRGAAVGRCLRLVVHARARVGPDLLRSHRPRTQRGRAGRQQGGAAARLPARDRRVRALERRPGPVRPQDRPERRRRHAVQRSGQPGQQHHRDDHRPGRQRAAAQLRGLRPRGPGRDARRHVLGLRRVRPVHHPLRPSRSGDPETVAHRRHPAARAHRARAEQGHGGADHHPERPDPGRHHAGRARRTRRTEVQERLRAPHRHRRPADACLARVRLPPPQHRRTHHRGQ